MHLPGPHSGDAIGAVRVHHHACGNGTGEHILARAARAPPNVTFAFAISNGHAGTKFLGSQQMWERHLPKGSAFPTSVRVEFEEFPQNLAVQQIGIHNNHCSVGRLYVVPNEG